jgi:hypothetical protein
MQLLGKVELSALNLPDALEFTATREDDWVTYLIAPGFGLVVLWWFFWRNGTPWPRLISGVAAGVTVLSYIANRLHGRETKLRVTNEELAAEGNLGRIFLTRYRIATADLSSIRYDDGGDGGIGGLYIWHGWTSACVLPGVSREQADSIVDAIARRFPHLPTERSESKSWLGDTPIELGLSKLNREDSESKS